MDDLFLSYVLVGFVAQLVDGALGMAYGVTSTAFLLTLGLSPASASASVHAAEVFTTGVSGLSHLYHRNVDRQLFLKLVVPGCLGGILGAVFLTSVPGDAIRPFIGVYLAVMGAVILWKARSNRQVTRRPIAAAPLGFIGALLDAIGGGGWGPIVTSTLLAGGGVPRYVIGSVNLAEFFVTVATSAAFVVSIGLEYTGIVIGLLIGGVFAAPLGAYLAKRLPARLIMVVVALVIIALSLYTLTTSLPARWFA